MPPLRRFAPLLSTSVFCFLIVGFAAAQTSHEPTPRLLSGFVENRGQFAPEATFAARVGRSWTFATRDGLRIVAPKDVGAYAVFLSFEGGRAREAVGEALRPGAFSYFAGSDPAKWISNVPVYERVRLVDVWPSVDVVLVERDGRLAYDLDVREGARLSDVVIRIEGATDLRIDVDGSLLADTPIGPLRQTAPIAWRTADGAASREVAYAFRRVDGARFGFSSAEDDAGVVRERTLVDPSLQWFGYLGGNNFDELFAVATDAAGAAYFGGRSASPNFPTTPGAFDVAQSVGNFDAVAAKVDASGTTLVYATFFGGSGTDRIEGVAVDATGAAYLTGLCDTGWPTTAGAHDTSYGGQGDAFVTKLAASGASLVWSTFVGGAQEDRGHAIAIDAAGAAYVTGQTLSTTSFPSTATSIVAGTGSGGNWNAFVVKVNAGGATLGYAARFGGSGVDWGFGVKVDAAGSAFVVGGTMSSNFFTTPGALNQIGGLDVFVAKINAAGTNYAWCARVGGPGSDQAFAVALDAAGFAYVAGAAGIGFPTTPGAYRTIGDGSDAFVFKIAANGASLLYCTYVGGTATEEAYALDVDAAGRAYVAGYTTSANLGTTSDALKPAYGGGGALGDGFVAKLAADGASARYVSYLGGPNDDHVTAIRLSGNGVLWIAGTTASSGFATGVGGVGPTFGGGALDGFGAKQLLPKSPLAVPFGLGWSVAGPTPTASCEAPTLGATPLASGAAAPPNAPGFAMLSTETPPLDVGSGLTLYGDLTVGLPVVVMTASAAGTWSSALPTIPASPFLDGVELVLQGAFLDAASPFGFVVTNPVRLTFGS
jgi:hypothetical protein